MELATLIGDVVGSRRYGDRANLQGAVAGVLERLNGRLRLEQPLEATVGDEFQGAFESVPEAVRASLIIRLELLEAGVETRYGLGFGSATVFDASRRPTSQDGPGWWAARAAIDAVKEMESSSRTSETRTWFAVEPIDPAATALRAFLLTRDALVARMNERHRRLLLGLLHGGRQIELAEREGVSQSAVSQALQASGAYAIAMAQQALEDPWSRSA
jgi:hypothetical protein